MTAQEFIVPPKYSIKEMLVINMSNKTLRLYFNYNHTIIEKLKQIPKRSWNPDRKCWELPYYEKYLAEVGIHKNISVHSLYQYFGKYSIN